MTDEEIASVDVGVQLLPMTAGEIVLAYNLPNGPKELKLSREAYTKIFLGQITKWNDPVIAKANPGVTLPDTAYHGGAPCGQQRHDLCVHAAPECHERGLEEWPGQWYNGELAEQR